MAKKYVKVKDRPKIVTAKELRTKIRHKKLLNAIVSGEGNLGSAMVKAGYSPATASNPKAIVETKSFQALMKEMLPDDFLMEKHKDLLQAEIKTSIRGEIVTERMDSEAVSKGLDMAYKLKGSYAPDKQVVLNLYQGKDDDEILKEIDRLEHELGIKRDRS